MATKSERRGPHTRAFGPRRPHIPPRWRPFLRLALVAAIVMVGDAVTWALTVHARSFSFPVVTAVRVAIAPLILRYPLSGFILALEVDKWDWYWLGMPHLSTAQQAVYQPWDKAVDLGHLSVAAIVALRWPDSRARKLALAMFAWRVIGAIAFFRVDSGWLLLVFPNVFENFFLLYLIFRTLSGQRQMLHSTRATVLVTVALLIPKVAEEYFLHVINQRPWWIVHVVSDGFDPWLWGAVMYALPLVALVVLVLYAHGRATQGDPEVQTGLAA